MGKAAVDLSFDDFGIELGSDVVNRDIFIDADRSGSAVDLHRHQIDYEAERDRGSNPIFVIGRAQDWRRHDGSLMNSGGGMVRQTGGAPLRPCPRLSARPSPV